jgi:hypothetical protein
VEYFLNFVAVRYFTFSRCRSGMSVHFRVDSWSGWVYASASTRTENLTTGQPRYAIFFEFSGRVHILSLPGAEVE